LEASVLGFLEVGVVDVDFCAERVHELIELYDFFDDYLDRLLFHGFLLLMGHS
jgi:hypothetical protein